MILFFSLSLSLFCFMGGGVHFRGRIQQSPIRGNIEENGHLSKMVSARPPQIADEIAHVFPPMSAASLPGSASFSTELDWPFILVLSSGELGTPLCAGTCKSPSVPSSILRGNCLDSTRDSERERERKRCLHKLGQARFCLVGLHGSHVR